MQTTDKDHIAKTLKDCLEYLLKDCEDAGFQAAAIHLRIAQQELDAAHPSKSQHTAQRA